MFKPSTQNPQAVGPRDHPPRRRRECFRFRRSKSVVFSNVDVLENASGVTLADESSIPMWAYE